MQLINTFDFSRAILHIDGDSFFVLCEVAKNPKLRGKPVITGMERGIVSAFSYEAKARGVKRAMRISEVKKICPDAIFLPSDYETYSLFSLRMYDIVRKYTPDVEEYSIDECFADLTGLRRPLGMSYENMAAKIKKDLDSELGITFSVGLAPTKVLAKIGSKHKKPSGLTIIRGRDIDQYLNETPVSEVWGIGSQTSSFLHKFGIRSALQYAQKEERWVREKLTKPHFQIWQELRGESVYKIETSKKNDYKSISKTKTFTPASSNKEFVFSQLSKNVENACIKLRRYNLSVKKIFFFLKTQDFQYCGVEVKMSDATNTPNSILNIIDSHFEKIFDSSKLFRATGIILSDLSISQARQLDLFGKMEQEENFSKIFKKIDEISKKYGKHSVFLGTSFLAMNKKQHQSERGVQSERKLNLFNGETTRKKLYLPMLGEVR
ncbi:DNA polymerase IV [Candidatus Parcubacteria bacterium]|nr:DNA polymerase IV [Candidatus Parcubacteria bacterium]